MRNDKGSILERLKAKYLEIEERIKNKNVEISLLQDFLLHLNTYDYNYVYSNNLLSAFFMNYDFVKFKEALEILSRFYDFSAPQVIESKKIVNDAKEICETGITNNYQDLELLNKEYEKEKKLYQKYHIILTNLQNTFLDNDELEQMIAYLYQNGITIEEIRNIVYRIKEKLSFEENHPKLPQLTLEEKEEIESYINQYNHLTDRQKETIFSAQAFIQVKDYDNLSNISYDLSQNEILYYSLIYSIIEKYNRYIESTKEENINSIANDDELLNVVKLELDDIIQFIHNAIEKIKKLEDEIENEEVLDIEDDSQKQNLVIFLNTKESNASGELIEDDVTRFDVDRIDDKSDGSFDNDMTMILRLLNTKLLQMPSVDIRRLGPQFNKPLSNGKHKEYPKFDEYNVYCLKSKVRNPARITYITLPVSANNQIELIERYQMNIGFQLYLVLGIFTKKNNDSEYVRITHNRLAKEKENIDNLIKMLSIDFTDETRKTIFHMIDDGLLTVNNLNDKYLTKGETL